MENSVFEIKNIWTWFEDNNEFLDKNNKHDYKLKLIKLTFFAITYYKACQGKDLVNEEFEAWRDGPVSNTAYAQISNDDRSSEMDKFDLYPEVNEFLQEINDIFGIYSANALSRCSHQLDSWKNNYHTDTLGNPIKHTVIPNEQLEEEFQTIAYNLNYFYKYDPKNESVCIINDKTIIYNNIDADLFEQKYHQIYNTVTNPDNFKNEDLIFVSFDNREVHYEI